MVVENTKTHLILLIYKTSDENLCQFSLNYN